MYIIHYNVYISTLFYIFSSHFLNRVSLSVCLSVHHKNTTAV